MKVTGERYFPEVGKAALLPYEPFISYEHWHRYCYALPFVTGKRVLDIASGEGYGSAFLAVHAAQVTGVDISEEAVNHASASYVRDNLQYLQGTAGAIPIAGEHCFDVVVSFETLEHLDEPTQERFAAEITRLLKPDGVLLISTPNQVTYSPDGAHGNPYHFHEFNKDEFVAFLHRYFAHVRVLSQHVYPVSYIWNTEGPVSGPVAEYQMKLEDKKFRPQAGDTKEIGYLIAVCSRQGEQAVGRDSLLIDVSEVAFRGIPGRERWQYSSLFLDTGAGYRAEEVVRDDVEYCPEFSLQFTLDPSVPVRQLRWDPLEMRRCLVRLRQVLWQDGDGRVSRLDLGLVTSNGSKRGEASFQFETLDPMVFLPIAGSVASITIEGECITADQFGTLPEPQPTVDSGAHRPAQPVPDLEGTSRQLAAYEQTIAALTEELRGREQRIQELEQIHEARLQAILRSKRWLVINGVRSAVFLLPALVRSARRRVSGRRREGARELEPAASIQRRPVASHRTPHQHSGSSRETLT